VPRNSLCVRRRDSDAGLSWTEEDSWPTPLAVPLSKISAASIKHSGKGVDIGAGLPSGSGADLIAIIAP